MDFQAILKALRAKFPQMRLPERGVSLQESCPKCGLATLVCVHKDVGLTDYYDEFEHICLAPGCDYRVYKQQYCGLGQESISDQLCPFCRRDVFERL